MEEANTTLQNNYPPKKKKERILSLCSFILSPNLVIILITIALDSLSLKLFISLSLGFFHGFFLFLSFETNSSTLSFC